MSRASTWPFNEVTFVSTFLHSLFPLFLFESSLNQLPTLFLRVTGHLPGRRVPSRRAVSGAAGSSHTVELHLSVLRPQVTALVSTSPSRSVWWGTRDDVTASSVMSATPETSRRYISRCTFHRLLQMSGAGSGEQCTSETVSLICIRYICLQDS